jgi:hypothetical protein
MFLDHKPVDGAQLGASLIEGGTGSEMAEEFSHAMDMGICDAGFEDTDGGGRPIAKDTAIKANGFADDRRIFLKSGRQKRYVRTTTPAALGPSS